MLQKDKAGSKIAIAKFLHTEDPELLEASLQFGVAVIERTPNLDVMRHSAPGRILCAMAAIAIVQLQ